MRFLTLLLLLFSTNAFAIEGSWYYGAVVTNPTTSTVFTTSGALPASGSVATPPTAYYLVGMFLYCSVATTYEVQVVNSSSVVTATVPFACSSTQPNVIPSGEISFPIQDGWTIQVVPSAGFTGFGSANLFMAKQSIK
jgi:hypothetical protein